MSTEPNQVKWVGIRLAAGESALPVSVIDPTAINDTDNDTKVNTEANPDEDKVRIHTAGVERVVIDASGIDVKSHKILSLAAPAAAGDAIRQTTKITEAALEDAVDKKHTQSHVITSTSDHTSTATAGKILKADASGLPADATNTDTEVADAVIKKHTQNTDKKIIDADADTQIQVEESADEDKVRMDVKGVEAFLLDDAGILTLAKNSGARAYGNTDQNNIASGVSTKVTLNVKTYDIQAEFDSATNYRFTAKVAGYYQVNGSVLWTVTVVDKNYHVRIYKNGVDVAISYNQASVATYLACKISDVIYLAVNDYVELWAMQETDAATPDIVASSSYTFLSIAKIG